MGLLGVVDSGMDVCNYVAWRRVHKDLAWPEMGLAALDMNFVCMDVHTPSIHCEKKGEVMLCCRE